jgi:16S rRNA (guanine966-N2)-methyltransferase
MRIVGGTYRGKILASPEGMSTRPTSDRARESIFNILRHAKWLESPALEDALVLDVFAGTGALGLEALSQGANHAVFIEKDRAALKACEKNITALKQAECAILMPGDALRPSPRPGGIAPRTLVFLDPPYGKGWGSAALTALTAQGWLADGALCVMEMAKKQPEDVPPGFILHDERAYGVALVRFLQKTP